MKYRCMSEHLYMIFKENMNIMLEKLSYDELKIL